MQGNPEITNMIPKELFEEFGILLAWIGIFSVKRYHRLIKPKCPSVDTVSAIAERKQAKRICYLYYICICVVIILFIG